MTVLAEAEPRVITQTVRPEPVEGLPAGWLAVLLSDVIQPVSTTDPARKPDVEITYFDISSIHNESGVVVDPKVVRGADAPSRARQAVETGDVLFSTVRPNLRAIAQVPNAANGVASTGFCVLRAADAVEPKYLYYFVRSEAFLDAVLPLQRGVSYPAVRSVDVVSQSIPLAPALEQTRIVEKLEELLSDLDAGVAELKAAQKKLTQYRQSLLKAAVEGALTTEWRAQRQAAAHAAPSPQPLPHTGGGAHTRNAASSAPLSPRGRGAGGEGVVAYAAQSLADATWLKARARELRTQQTPAEHALWQQLRAKRFDQFKFKRQSPIGRYIVDFVCFTAKLVVELDGGQHAEAGAYDAERDRWLVSQGFRVLRFWNNEWFGQTEAVLEKIWAELHEPLSAHGSAPLPPGGGGAGGEGANGAVMPPPPLPNPSPTRGEGLFNESGAQLLERVLKERRARWQAKQLAKFKEQGKAPPKDWQDKYPEPVKPDTTDLPPLPEGWVWASLEQISEIQGGIQKQPSRAPVLHKYPFLRVANVARSQLKLDEIHEIELFPGELERLALIQGDLLIVEGNGSLSEIGRCALWDGSIENTVHQNHLIRARPIVMRSVFMEAWLNSLHGVTLMTRLAATTSGLYTLSVGKIGKIPIPIPPLDEQTALIALLNDAIEEQETQSQNVRLALKQSTAQRKNILKAAFSGQLVPQDPNDEPASVLLARIRAERAGLASKPRVGRRKAALADVI